MRTTIVPAQVTTVEDKIAGNLGITQLLLLTMPIFGGSLLFVGLPPFFSYATYKIVVIMCFAVMCGTLAIRIKGKILLLWGIVIFRYNLRPRYYVPDCNHIHLRNISSETKPEKIAKETQPKQIRKQLPKLSTSDLVQVEHLIADPAANLRLMTNRKGEISVHLTEIK
jgi:hypothetical protein